MLQKIRNNMFYIVTPIYWIVLVALYPIAVPQYCSEATFLLGWLLFVLIASLNHPINIEFTREKKLKTINSKYLS